MRGALALALLALALPVAAPLAAEDRTCAAALAQPSGSFAMAIAANDGRSVPVTIFHPAAPGDYPLVVFSHGAYSDPARYTAMLAPLAGAGLIILAPTHVDSETLAGTARPPHALTWLTRNAEMAALLAARPDIDARLATLGLRADRKAPVAMGHSYGALIAQLPGGAVAIEPDGGAVDRRHAGLAAVVAWSPPGPFPGLMAADGWRSLAVPSLTLTGTGDVLPGFIDDWRAHRASFDNAPQGQRMLWVGDGVDHYFGGTFGRLKDADGAQRALFGRALETALAFIERHAGRKAACRAGPADPAESITRD